MLRAFHLKYSESGLFFAYQRTKETGYKSDLFVSADWKKILTFLGIRYEKWLSGFDSLEEMFDWVVESPYFDSKPYLDPDPRVIKRLCGSRTTVRKFIEYIGRRKINHEFTYEAGRKDCVDMIEDHFPGSNLASKVQQEQQQEELAEQRKNEDALVKAKFNGKLVMEWIPELQREALGRFMDKIRSEYSHDQLLSMPAAAIKEDVLKRAESMGIHSR